jgi:hypothetical protein
MTDAPCTTVPGTITIRDATTSRVEVCFWYSCSSWPPMIIGYDRMNETNQAIEWAESIIGL